MTPQEKSKVEEDAAYVRSMMQGCDSSVDKRQKILERVRAILALADDEQSHNPAAADNYRAQADKLMTVYAIEEWQLEQVQKSSTGQIRKPEVRYFDITWWYTGNPEFHHDIYFMFESIARHCRVVIAHRGQGKNGHSYREMPLIGLTSDLDYFDMLFTHLLLQMGKQLEPKPDPDKSFGENAYTLRASGMARPRIAELLYDLGIIPNVNTLGYIESSGIKIPYNQLAPNKEKSLRARVRVAGEKWGAENGLDPTTTVNPKVWQRSFSQGFVMGVATKLREMQQIQEDTPTQSGPSVAVALRDIYDMALVLYKEMFPPPPPIKIEPSTTVTKSRLRTGRLPAPPKTSDKAYAAGRAAGRKAEIGSHPSKRVGNNPKRIGQ